MCAIFHNVCLNHAATQLQKRMTIANPMTTPLGKKISLERNYTRRSYLYLIPEVLAFEKKLFLNPVCSSTAQVQNSGVKSTLYDTLNASFVLTSSGGSTNHSMWIPATKLQSFFSCALRHSKIEVLTYCQMCHG